MIEVDYNEYKETLEANMRLIPENHKLKEEIERLKNIINEFKKWLIAKGETIPYHHLAESNLIDEVLDKLIELRGDKE